jgi:hypothetical protein
LAFISIERKRPIKVIIGFFSEALLRHPPSPASAWQANLKLAPCPARSVAAATFAFYLADPISSIHEFHTN